MTLTPLPTSPLPRLLLIEDDPVSQSFMAAVLESLPAEVDRASDSRTALLQAQSMHDVWLIDMNLPDGNGDALLLQLRARHPHTPALAHTADTTPALAARLRETGFDAVLTKPFTQNTLQQAVRELLGAQPMRSESSSLPHWDDAHALRALNGQHTHLTALRELFMHELPVVRHSLMQAAHGQDQDALRQHLHRLQASCGFVGATRLGLQARHLHANPSDKQQQDAVFSAIDHLLLA